MTQQVILAGEPLQRDDIPEELDNAIQDFYERCLKVDPLVKVVAYPSHHSLKFVDCKITMYSPKHKLVSHYMVWQRVDGTLEGTHLGDDFDVESYDI